MVSYKSVTMRAAIFWWLQRIDVKSLFGVSFLNSFAVNSMGKTEVVALLLASGCQVAMIVLLPPPRGEVGWSVVCDCGISWSNSLAFCEAVVFKY